MGTLLGEQPFTRADALAAGLSPATIRRMLRDGDWVALRRGVYVARSALAGAPDRRHALDVAAVLVTVHHDALAATTSAARILGLELLAPPSDEIVVVTSDPAGKGQRRDGYVLRYADVPPVHRAECHGVAITSAARTVVDLARDRPIREGVVVVDSALRRHLVTVPELRAMTRDCFTKPRINRAHQAIELVDPNSESVLESVSRVAMHEQELPPPRTQVVIRDARGPIARVDFLWEHCGVIGEADGLGKYEPDGWRSTREIVRAEKRREERILDAGYEIVRWGWQEANNPPVLAHRLRAAFARGLERRRGRSRTDSPSPKVGSASSNSSMRQLGERVHRVGEV